MNDKLTNSRLVPQRAILVYPSQSERNREFYMESREVKRVKGKYVFMAPTPVTDRVITELGKACSKSKFHDMQFGGLIPEHLLYCSNKEGKTVVVWYRKATSRTLNLSYTVGIETTRMVQLPATLYAIADNKLYIFALSSDDRPTKDTKLYNAPFFNIYASGNVCLGTAPIGSVKGKTFEREADRFERAFYLAEQNGGGHNPCKSDLSKLWRRLIAKPQAFPKKELKLHGKCRTLSGFMNLIVNKSLDDED